MLVLANKKLKANDKFIRTGGIVGVDTMLSIYNEKGITAGESFTKGMVYNYEIAIPLKYIKLQGKPTKFSYHIVLNGISVDKDSGLKMTKGTNGVMAISFAPGFVTIQNKDMPAVMATTDFWGEYTLVK